MTDPLFLHELALELGKSVRETVESMSAHELTVAWPLYFKYRAKAQERQAREDEMQRGSLR
jgi:hypothetical protein